MMVAKSTIQMALAAGLVSMTLVRQPAASCDPAFVGEGDSETTPAFDTRVLVDEEGRRVGIYSPGGTTPSRRAEVDAGSYPDRIPTLEAEAGRTVPATEVRWESDEKCLTVADQNLTPVSSVGEAGFADLVDYVNVIRTADNSDECADCRTMRGPRTGTKVGVAVHDWMVGKLSAILGAENVVKQSWVVPRYVPRDFSLRVETGEDVFTPAIFPWYYRGFTGPDGVSGPLAWIGVGTAAEIAAAGDLTGKIVVIESPLVFNAISVTANRALQGAAEAGAVGALVAMLGPKNEILAQNQDLHEYLADSLPPIPTAIIGKLDAARLRELEGSTATLVVDGEVREGSESDGTSTWGLAHNVVGVIPGENPDDFLVIGTPLNGWFTVASERGPGIAGFLHAARYWAAEAAASRRPAYTLLFVATGGHEIYGLGLERFLDCVETARIVTYFHYGAGMAGKDYVDVNGTLIETGVPDDTRSLYVSENPILETVVHPWFFNKPFGQPNFTLPPAAFNPGEQQSAYGSGIPIVAMSGAGVYHHAPGDTPDNTSPQILEPLIVAYREAIEAVLGQDGDAIRSANAVAAAAGSTEYSGSCPAEGLPPF